MHCFLKMHLCVRISPKYRMLRYLWCASLLVWIVVSLATAQISNYTDENGNNKVIYGQDNRIEPYLLDSSYAGKKTAEMADAEVALLFGFKLSLNPANGYYSLGSIYRTKFTSRGGNALCASEPFYGQYNPAFCSGFLVAPNIIATAGHCITNQFRCDSTKFVFGFQQKGPNQDPQMDYIPQNNVYQCKRIIANFKRQYFDFALAEMDRPVVGRVVPPLNFRSNLRLQTPLVVIGHPVGLPTKIAGGAEVKQYSVLGQFQANLDTYAGNSGSLVFNTNTWQAEGILVSGQDDFVKDPVSGCMKSNNCGNSGCFGNSGWESISSPVQFAQYVPGYKGLVVNSASKLLYILQGPTWSGQLYDYTYIKMTNTDDKPLNFYASLQSSVFDVTSPTTSPLFFVGTGKTTQYGSLPAGESAVLRLKRNLKVRFDQGSDINMYVTDTTVNPPIGPMPDSRWIVFQSSTYSRICTPGKYSINQDLATTRSDYLACNSDPTPIPLNTLVLTAATDGWVSLTTCAKGDPQQTAVVYMTELNCDYTLERNFACDKDECGFDLKINRYPVKAGKTYVVGVGNKDGSFVSDGLTLTVSSNVTFVCNNAPLSCTKTFLSGVPSRATTTTTTQTSTSSAPAPTASKSTSQQVSSSSSSSTTAHPTSSTVLTKVISATPTSAQTVAGATQNTCSPIAYVSFAILLKQKTVFSAVEASWNQIIQQYISANEKRLGNFVSGEVYEYSSTLVSSTVIEVRLTILGSGISTNRKYCKLAYILENKEDLQNELDWQIKDAISATKQYSDINSNDSPPSD